MRWSASWVALMCVAPVGAHANAAWEVPAYAVAGEPFVGRVTVPSADSPGVVWWRISDEVPRAAQSSSVSDEVSFTVAVPVDAAASTLTIGIGPSTDGSRAAGSISVPVAERKDVEVAGITGAHLVYPLDPWPLSVLFEPCCLIVSGAVQVDRFAVSPSGSNVGLPEVVLSNFYRVDPDDMVKATGGVRIRLAYDAEKARHIDTATIRVYRWKEGSWIPVQDVSRQVEQGTVVFGFADGGDCVVAASTLSQ